MSGEIQLQFSIIDADNPSATPLDILNKFASVTASSPNEEKFEELELAQMEAGGELDGDVDADEETSDELDDQGSDLSNEAAKADTPEKREKRRRMLRLKMLKKKTKARAYEFAGGSTCVGIVFLEIGKVTDLPPERNGMLPWNFTGVLH